LVDLKRVDVIFEVFLKELEKLGLIVNEGKIIDASFIEVPRQRNTREENKQIKIDAKSKLITKYDVSPANIHDSQAMDYLLDEKDKG
jgi:hypothetical protein